jgi:hypothetical protein
MAEHHAEWGDHPINGVRAPAPLGFPGFAARTDLALM